MISNSEGRENAVKKTIRKHSKDVPSLSNLGSGSHEHVSKSLISKVKRSQSINKLSEKQTVRRLHQQTRLAKFSSTNAILRPISKRSRSSSSSSSSKNSRKLNIFF